MSHQWKFFRAGGFDQVQLDSGADLLALEQLDQKLWVALGCPTRGLEFDSKTLDLIDSDSDGHVRANDVLAAIRWSDSVLKSLEPLTQGQQQLNLADINESSDDGRAILAAAQHMLRSLDKADANTVTLDDIVVMEKKIAELAFNGDGVISAKHHADVAKIVSCVGSVPDLSGEPGINQALSDHFFSQAEAWLSWQRAANSDILLLGDATQAAVDALSAVKIKIDDFFTRCQLAAYDARAAAPLNRSIEDYAACAPLSLSAQSAEIASFPLATVAAEKALPLDVGINPAWHTQLITFREAVVRPLLGERDSLSYADWQKLCTQFDAYANWQAAKPANQVEALGAAELQTILAQRGQIESLLQRDAAAATEIDAIHKVEKLLRYQQHLFNLINNFVSFRDFYTGKNQAIFQIGTLYLDGRSCELCVKVDDVAKHAGFANSSGICLAYCECVRGTQKMTIAAAFTAGDSDYLSVGRNGIFYDRKGQDWDATIVRMLDHPISLRQAFWLPYKKLVNLISEQLQKFVSAKAGAVDDKLLKASSEAIKPVTDTSAAAKPAFDIGKFAGIFAAIGLAIAAIGSMVSSLVASIMALKAWQMPLALLGVMLLISGPSMILAAFKLKRRNLAPVLDANGWAVNSRARINIAFGTSLTAMAALPAGASRSMVDPYADQRSKWPVYLIILLGILLGLWYGGLITW